MWSIPTSNSDGRAFMVVIIVFYAIAVVAYGLRVYSRRLNRAALDASDYTCLLGLAFDIGLVVILWGSYSHGVGQDISKFTVDDGRFEGKNFIVILIIWNAATVSIRVSMILFYIRIFPVGAFRMLCRIIIGISLLSFIAVILATLLICWPITYSFDKTIPGGSCGDLLKFELFNTIWNLISDFIIVVLPMPMLWRLQMHTKKKFGLSIVFGMGVFICALTLTRVIAMKDYQIHNYTKQASLIGLITRLEPIAGVINASLPFLPRVFQRVAQTSFFTRVSTSPTFITSNKANQKKTTGPAADCDIIRVNHSAKLRGLADIEMFSAVLKKHSRFEWNYISTVSTDHSQSQIYSNDSRPWDSFIGRDRIFVQHDLLIESE